MRRQEGLLVWQQSHHHVVAPLPTKTFQRCCPLLWRPTETDRRTKKPSKIPPPGSVSAQLSPPLGTFGEGSPGHTENTDPRTADLRHEMERLQTESAHAHCGTERKVIGPLTPILSDHCPSLGLS